MTNVDLAALQFAEKLSTVSIKEEIDSDQLFSKMHDEISLIVKSIGSNVMCSNKDSDSCTDYYELYIREDGLKYKRFQQATKSIVILSFSDKSIFVNNQPVSVDYLTDLVLRISEIIRDIKSGKTKVKEGTK